MSEFDRIIYDHKTGNWHNEAGEVVAMPDPEALSIAAYEASLGKATAVESKPADEPRWQAPADRPWCHAGGWAPMADRMLVRLVTGEEKRTSGGIVLPGKDTHSRERMEAWTLRVLAVSRRCYDEGYRPGMVVRVLRHACVEIEEEAKLYTAQMVDVVAVQAERAQEGE